MTQNNRILEHMRTKGGITSMEAFSEYGITRLSARIYDLRHLGYDVRTLKCDSINRYGDVCYFAKYYLVENGTEV